MNEIFQKIVTNNKHVLKLSHLVWAHKITSSAIVAALILGGYWGMGVWGNNSNEARYVLAAVERGDIVISVTASGQVSASNQIDVKPKISGEVVWLGVKSGQFVKNGSIIAQLDTREAQRAIRDAETNLESAKIALAKIKKPADDLSQTQTENDLTQAEADLKKSYDDGFNAVADSFVELSTVVSGLQDILYGTGAGSSGQSNISAYHDMVKAYDESVTQLKEDVAYKYIVARNDYEENFKQYKSATRFSNEAAIENLIEKSYETAKKIAEAVKSSDNLLSFVKDELAERNLNLPAILAAHRSSLADYTFKTNSHLNGLLNARENITAAKRDVLEKTKAWEKLKTGADSLDIAAQELAVKQKGNALLDAKEKLADYYIRAPFSGTVAQVDLKKSDNISVSDVAAVIITSQKFAEISLNEIDIAQIKIGQKAKLTFDAVENINLEGEVAEIDIIGEVNQGVVTYNVKVAFESSDERIKPGMSVTATITTFVKENVLTVPNGAVKPRGNTRFVETIENSLPAPLARSSQIAASAVSLKEQPVETGLDNDTVTEIISGLNEGDKIVVRTINSQSQNNNSPTPSLFGPPGGNRSGGSFRSQVR